MTINKQKLLLGLGMASIAIAPVAMVVSCSSSPDQSNTNTPAPGVSQEKWNQYVELFGLKKEDGSSTSTKAKKAYGEAIKAATAATTSKTEDEVKADATTKLAAMTDQQLEDTIFTSLNLSNYGEIVSFDEEVFGEGKLQYEKKDENKMFSNVEIIKWDKTTKEISFKVTTQMSEKSIKKYDYDTKNEKYNKTYESTRFSKTTIEYKNFQLSPVAVKINNNTLSTGFELKSIDKKSTISKPSFEQNEPKGLNDFSRFMINNNKSYTDAEKKAKIKELDDQDKEYDKLLKAQREFYGKIEANKIGKVGGTGEIIINTSNTDDWMDAQEDISFMGNGFGISGTETNPTFAYKALSFGKPFIFATINKEANAEATITFDMYKKATSPEEK